MLQFSKQRKTAIRKYQEFVEAGLKLGPIWGRLNNQIYLGEAEFIDKVQQHLKQQGDDLQIPKAQRRKKPIRLLTMKRKTLQEMKRLLKLTPVALIPIRRWLSILGYISPR